MNVIEEIQDLKTKLEAAELVIHTALRHVKNGSRQEAHAVLNEFVEQNDLDERWLGTEAKT
jgi:hypothetical protein